VSLEGVPSLFTWLDESGTEHRLDVDVVNSVTDERTATLTDHSVETGSVITDHVVIMPETVSLELVVSQTPIDDAAEGMARADISFTTTDQALEATDVPIKVRQSEFKPGGFLLLSTGVRIAATALVSTILGAATGGTNVARGSKTTRRAVSGRANVLQSSGGARDRVADVHDNLIRILQGALLVSVNFRGRIYEDYLLTRVTLSANPGEFGMGRFSVDARAFRTVTGVTVALPDPADFRALPKANSGSKPAKTPDPDPTKLKSFAAQGFDAL
jgi:Dit-like tail protein